MAKAVIFDFDGVIADTMKDNCSSWQAALATQGVTIAPSEYYPLEGMGRFQIARHFVEKYKLDQAKAEEIAVAKEQNYNANNFFKLYDEIPAIFDLLKQKNIQTAIVTGASRHRILTHLDKSIVEELTVLVTADDVTHTKPHPEPYLKAVQELKVPANECIVVENAILGIKSAQAAGCRCFAVETTLSRGELRFADAVFATHKELLTTFESIF